MEWASLMSQILFASSLTKKEWDAECVPLFDSILAGFNLNNHHLEFVNTLRT